MTLFFATMLFVCMVWWLFICVAGAGAVMFLPSSPPKQPLERLDPNRWDKKHYEAYIKRSFGGFGSQGPTGGKRLHRGYE